MRLLVLGGTRFVGRAAVQAAIRRGDDVTVVNRGISGHVPDAAELVLADRTDPPALGRALRTGEWDAVLDTWSGAPRFVNAAVQLLAGRVGHYLYVSSRSVYAWPLAVGSDESAPVVSGSAVSDDADDYPAAKRGGELAVLSRFDGHALLARAGLILGPYENVGRLPWWLRRIARSGKFLAPGPADQPLQYVDVRDLADFLLLAADRNLAGAVNTVSETGHTTMGRLLAACVSVTGSGAVPAWATPQQIAAAGLQPWTELPIWLPPDGEDAGLHRGNVTAARAAGLTCRPVEQTVADTWSWMQDEGEPPPPPERPTPGLDPAREAAALAQL